MIEGAVVAVVVPAYNEQRWLGEVLDTMPDFVDRIVVVDDGSVDGTAQVVEQRRQLTAPSGERIALLRHPRNQGVGAAIVRGYEHACRGGAQVVAVMAGDGQMHPDDLLAVVQPVARGDADYAKGDRLHHPQVRRVMPTARYLVSWLLSWLTSRASGVAVCDSQCGYTAASARALSRLDLDGLWAGFGYPNDLIGAFARSGARVADVPVRPVYRGEQSGLRPWHGVTIGFLLARVAWRRRVRSARAWNEVQEENHRKTGRQEEH